MTHTGRALGRRERVALGTGGGDLGLVVETAVGRRVPVVDGGGGGIESRVLLAADAGRVGRVGDGDSLGVFVLGVMFLGMDLLMLLEVLRALERFLADNTDMGLERRVDWGPGCEIRDRGKQKDDGYAPRRWLVMWSRFAQLVPQSFHLHVRQRLPVLLRPMWSLQRWL